MAIDKLVPIHYNIIIVQRIDKSPKCTRLDCQDTTLKPFTIYTSSGKTIDLKSNI